MSTLGGDEPDGTACPLALTPLYSENRQMTGSKGEPIPVEQIHEQHPHRGDWLREIVFGRARWLGHHPGVHHGSERDCARAASPSRAG